MPLLGKLIWAFLIGMVVFLFVLKFIGKRKYQGVDMAVDTDWYMKSQEKYLEDNRKRAYFFHYDTNFLSQGHVMEDKNHKIVYEAKFLYNNVNKPDEVDFENHIINYKHHHKVGHTHNTSFSTGNVGAIINSTFTFDGQDVYEYLENLGYSFKFNIHGLAYSIDIIKNNFYVGKIYSSNNGKNFFDCEPPYEPKMGGTGLVIVETDYENLDALFLYAIVFARTDLSTKHM